MTDDDGPKIPFAWDPMGHKRIHISEVAQSPHHRSYLCEKCNEQLVPALGDIQIHHFRHSPTATKPCELHFVPGIEKYQREVRESPVEVAERQKRLRLVLIPNPYTAQAEVYGLLPSLSWDVVEDSSDINDVLEGLSARCKGIVQQIDPRWFHPTRAEVLVQLDPSAMTYVIELDSAHNGIGVDGTWETDTISDSDIFVGESHRGERIHGNMTIAEGDFVFLVLREVPTLDFDSFETYSLGPWQVIAFEVNEATKPFLLEHLGEHAFDENTFHADLLVPGYASPRAESPVSGTAESEAIIAILPPPNLDPEFEVIPIPLDEENLVPVARRGEGIPRFVSIPFPHTGSRRINIHWGGRHRLIHLHTVDEEITTVESPSNRHPPIGLHLRDEDRFLVPWESENEATLEMTKDDGLAGRVDFQGPRGLHVDLEGLFPSDSELPGIVIARELDLAQVQDRLDDWIYEGCQEALINFDSLGNIRLSFKPRPSRKHGNGFTEILDKVGRMDPLPSRASWATVREVLRIPSGTPHSEVLGGMKKKVRRALMQVRKRDRRD